MKNIYIENTHIIKQNNKIVNSLPEYINKYTNKYINQSINI